MEFDGGTQLLGSQLPAVADPGSVVNGTAWLELASLPLVSAELSIWGAGAGGPVDVLKYDLADPAGGFPSGTQVRLDLPIKLPSDLSPGAYWLLLSLRGPVGVLEASHFRKGRVSLGTVLVGRSTPPRRVESVPDFGDAPVLVAGGDVNLGRRQNGISGSQGVEVALGGLDELQSADLAFVNLEAVVASGGQQGIDKGEKAPFYYRGRPEMLGVLSAGGVDVVGVANNHSGDYGRDALMEQQALLTAMGVGAPGAGATRDSACSPVFRRAGDLTVAVFGVDATQWGFGAGEDSPGTCHLALTSPEAWERELGPRIAAAREQAHLVLVAPHWGPNKKSRPRMETRRIARLLIDMGTDAVLGTSAHMVQGVEIYRGRPILYDMGNLLFDSHETGEISRSFLFTLALSADGVVGLRARPMDVGYGVTSWASGNSAAKSLFRLRDLSSELGTDVQFQDNRAWVVLSPPPERPGPSKPGAEPVAPGPAPGPLASAPMGCQTQEVPSDARISPQRLGPLELLGVRLAPSKLVERQNVWVETWWRRVDPVTSDLWILQRMYRSEVRDMWWGDHEPCDWAWPTSRWDEGVIYTDRYWLHPPRPAPKGSYTLRIGLREEAALDRPIGQDVVLAGVVME